MLYIVRLLIILLVLSVAFILKTKVFKSKLNRIIMYSISLIIIAALVLFPIENIFITFKTPESLFSYTSSGNISDVIYGEDSCMIVYFKGNGTISYDFAIKTDNGYKIPDYFNAKKVSSKLDGTSHFDVYRISETSDYYVIGSINSAPAEYILYDGHGEQIDTDIRIIDEKVCIIAFALNEFSENYYFVVNDTKVHLA